MSSAGSNGPLEYSVVYTDRALNHMSSAFGEVMRELSSMLKTAYSADAAVIVPGGGTFAMEAVARQLATGKETLILRNGWFSFRWSQIFDAGSIPASTTVLKAAPVSSDTQAAWSPVPVDVAIARIAAEKPDLVFAPHVETASGIVLPDAYLKSLADAVHAAGGIFVLDCIASGAVWVDMKALGVDVLISAPQKGWSGPACAGFVMLSDHAIAAMEQTSSTSFAADLKKWSQVMKTYESGAHAYHATMPTDALRKVRDAMRETHVFGLDKAREAQVSLGARVREVLVRSGFPSVASPGFEAPTVVVSHTTDPEVKSGKKFLAIGMQVAAGVPLQCDEPPDFSTFRVGLFGLDKLANVERTVFRLEEAIRRLAA